MPTYGLFCPAAISILESKWDNSDIAPLILI